VNALSPPFKRLFVLRKRELVRSGMIASEARAWAIREATSRQDAVPIIGREAALSACLIKDIRSDGTYSIFLKISVGDVPEHLRDRAMAQDISHTRPDIFAPTP